MEASELMSAYCALLYQRFGTYEEVARRAKLDRRTVKKYLSNPFSTLNEKSLIENPGRNLVKSPVFIIHIFQRSPCIPSAS